MIHIACNIDDNYTQHCGVMINSLYENNKEERITVHVIVDKLSDNSKLSLTKITQKYNQSIYFHEVKGFALLQLPNLKDYNLSAAAYLRLFIPEILTELNKIIYLDCDLIIRKKITALWNTAISLYAIAGVEDAPYFPDKFERLNIPSQFGYFNSGVLLMNLKKLREEKFTSKAIEYIRDNFNKIVHHDQDVLNALLFDKKIFIPLTQNMMDVFSQEKPFIQQKYLSELNNCKNDSVIAHFAGKLKPWMCWIKSPFYKEYYKYLKLTEWKKFSPSLKTQMQARPFPRNILNILGVYYIYFMCSHLLRK